jgi:hypothetical protein
VGTGLLEPVAAEIGKRRHTAFIKSEQLLDVIAPKLLPDTVPAQKRRVADDEVHGGPFRFAHVCGTGILPVGCCTCGMGILPMLAHGRDARATRGSRGMGILPMLAHGRDARATSARATLNAYATHDAHPFPVCQSCLCWILQHVLHLLAKIFFISDEMVIIFGLSEFAAPVQDFVRLLGRERFPRVQDVCHVVPCGGA